MFFVPGSERVVQIHDLTAPTDYSEEAVNRQLTNPFKCRKTDTGTK